MSPRKINTYENISEVIIRVCVNSKERAIIHAMTCDKIFLKRARSSFGSRRLYAGLGLRSKFLFIQASYIRYIYTNACNQFSYSPQIKFCVANPPPRLLVKNVLVIKNSNLLYAPGVLFKLLWYMYWLMITILQ